MRAQTQKLTSAAVAQVRALAFDIDDTFSTDGKITADAFSVLWQLRAAGFKLVPITGRPAGWCDHIARFWPVDAVVGENGAFSFWMGEGKRKRHDTAGGPDAGKLARLRTAILAQFPDARFASDQSYREYDLAIDFREDVTPWPMDRVLELKAFCERQGAHAKVSSIHVNTWYGEFDKAAGFRALLAAGPKGLPRRLSAWAFVGDSPNDEPLFELFGRERGVTVGVGNLREFIGGKGALKHPPAFLTRKDSGGGFVELARALLRQKTLKTRR